MKHLPGDTLLPWGAHAAELKHGPWVVLLPTPVCPWDSQDLPSPGDAQQGQSRRKVLFQWEAQRQMAFSRSCARV